jgi:CheY-like chemotaxis protein
MVTPTSPPRGTTRLNLARVLLVHGDLAPRFGLQTILQAGGYAVDVAATPSEALAKLDEREYELVLSDNWVGSTNDARDILAYARIKEYRPATALITGSRPPTRRRLNPDTVAVQTENLPLLLGTVAELIGIRASRRSLRFREAG